jgi:hypothetical protein
MQSSGDVVYLLTFAVILGMVMAVIWAVIGALDLLGGLPGRIASARDHPRAVAISICGWLGLLVFPLWPLALVWAYLTPKKRQPQRKGLSEEEVDALAEDLDEASEQIAAIKRRLAVLPPPKKVA